VIRIYTGTDCKEQLRRHVSPEVRVDEHCASHFLRILNDVVREWQNSIETLSGTISGSNLLLFEYLRVDPKQCFLVSLLSTLAVGRGLKYLG
jgi:hypothetical protein